MDIFFRNTVVHGVLLQSFIDILIVVKEDVIHILIKHLQSIARITVNLGARFYEVELSFFRVEQNILVEYLDYIFILIGNKYVIKDGLFNIDLNLLDDRFFSSTLTFTDNLRAGLLFNLARIDDVKILNSKD